MKNKKYLWIFALILLVMITWAAIGMNEWDKEEKSFRISVILSDSSNDRWTALKNGLEEGAEEENVQLTIVMTDQLDRVSEQIDLMKREMENGADAILIEPYNKEQVSNFLEENTGTPVLFLNTDLEPENIYSLAATNPKEMGEHLAKALYEESPDWSECALYLGEMNTLYEAQRKEAFLSYLEKKGIEEEALTIVQTKEELSEYREKKDWVSFSNESLEELLEYGREQELLSDWTLFGCGYSEEAIYYLDKGTIAYLAVPDDFLMGYCGMIMAKNACTSSQKSYESKEISFVDLTRENLHDSEWERFAYPIGN